MSKAKRMTLGEFRERIKDYADDVFLAFYTGSDTEAELLSIYDDYYYYSDESQKAPTIVYIDLEVRR